MAANLKIGISGKRHVEPDQFRYVADEIEKKINCILIQHNVKTFIGYSGLASGADSIFADLVINKFKMPLHAILPFSPDEYEKDFNVRSDREKLEALLNGATKIHVLSNETPTNQQEKNKGYFEQGVWMVNHTTEMIFVWDELKPAGHGGTAEIMGYYHHHKNKNNVPYIKIKPKQEDLLYNRIVREFEQANEDAIAKRDIFKNVWKSVIFFSWLAVSLFAFKVAYRLEGKTELIVMVIEFVLIFTVFILFAVARKKDFHGTYLKNRLKAESFRLLLCFYNAAVNVNQRFVSSEKKGIISKFVQQINDSNRKTNYLSPWYAYYVIRSLICQQIDYHSERLQSISKKPEWLERVNLLVGLLFLVNLTIHLFDVTFFFITGSAAIPFYNDELAIFLSIFLPATYAAIEGTLHFQEWKMLKRCSEEAAKDLTECLKQFHAPSENKQGELFLLRQKEILVDVSRIMIADNNNWQLTLLDSNNYMLIL